MIKKISKEFEERFNIIFDGTKLNLCRDTDFQKIKDFLSSSLTKVLNEVEKEIKKLKEVDGEVKGNEILERNGSCCPADDTFLGYETALSEVLQIISKLKQ